MSVRAAVYGIADMKLVIMHKHEWPQVDTGNEVANNDTVDIRSRIAALAPIAFQKADGEQVRLRQVRLAPETRTLDAFDATV